MYHIFLIKENPSLEHSQVNVYNQTLQKFLDSKPGISPKQETKLQNKEKLED